MELNGLVGTEIEIKKHAEGYRIKKTKYLVLQAYKHYVLCEKITETGAEIRECFTKAELIQQGIITK